MKTVLNSITHSLLAGTAVGEVPEFIHLLPAGTFSGVDGRGPYELGDAQKLIAASLPAGRKLAMDINHSIDLLTSEGEETPAVGWIVALEAREDGIWGKVEWTEKGRHAVAGKEYGFVSPVFTSLTAKPYRLVQLLRASLTNDPNLKLTALHSRNHSLNHGDPEMDEELRKALGLPETADQAAILAALTTKLNASTAAADLMSRVAEAAGLKKEATGEEVVTALQARAASGDDAEKAELREQVKQLNSRVTTLVTTHAKDRAETVIDKAIEDGKLVPALRDHYIARHIKDPADVEVEIKLMPSLNSGGLGKRPAVETGDGTLAADEAVVCEMMGLDPKAFAQTAKEIAKEMH
ncbi:MAG TPA: phage protease [Mesorhizobium sp.]|jgi:phage I-like protein|uniref:phage protease n=1 Tax=Mesorhizobium sp. TaxID=1871066 RepID=UPI002DDCB7E8|nr:phage protease [Mesorhizobium sp.]HEV2501614.1 phage protease [Mesorhizobium sp.]